MHAIPAPDANDTEALLERLKRFLEIYTSSRVMENNQGALKMLVLLARNKNSKIKEKMINYKLGEIQKRMLEGQAMDGRAFVVCEFLMEELEKYMKSKL